MGLRISSGGIQLSLVNNFSRTNRFTDSATERLSTGLRINRGSDDPAGLIAAERLRNDVVDISARVRVLNARERQANIQESGRQAAADVLRSVRGLIVEASDGATSADQRQAIQGQVDASLDALDRLGAASGFALPASLEALRSGGSANLVDGDSAEAATIVDQELAAVNLARAAAGAYQKYTIDVDRRLAEDQAVAAASALSQIADTDYALESSNLVKGQILEAASIKTMALFQQLRSNQISSMLDLL